MQNIWSLTGRSIAVSTLALALAPAKACAVQSLLQNPIFQISLHRKILLDLLLQSKVTKTISQTHVC